MTHAALGDALAAAWDGLGGVTVSPLDRNRLRARAAVLVAHRARELGKDPVALFKAAAERFRADDHVRRKRLCSVAVLVSQLERWLDPPPEKRVKPHTMSESKARPEDDAKAEYVAPPPEVAAFLARGMRAPEES